MSLENKKRLLLLPFTLIVVGVFILFELWNPLPYLSYHQRHEVIGPALWLIPYLAIIFVLLNILIKALKLWAWLSIIYAPLAILFYYGFGLCENMFCSVDQVTIAIGRVYLFITILVILVVYIRDWYKKRTGKTKST